MELKFWSKWKRKQGKVGGVLLIVTQGSNVSVQPFCGNQIKVLECI